MKQISTPPDDELGGHPHPLSPREVEVMGYMVQGLSNIEIADALDIRPSTVSHHVVSIHVKLGARGRTRNQLIATYQAAQKFSGLPPVWWTPGLCWLLPKSELPLVLGWAEIAQG